MHRRRGHSTLMRCRVKSVIMIVVLLGIQTVAGQTQAERSIFWYHNINDEAVGLNGYDPVAYFTLNQAKQGKATFEVNVDGITWRFDNAAHRALFLGDPSAYRPQYGGWCALAIGVDSKKFAFGAVRFDVEPNAFKIIAGKLYLFAKLPNFDALALWNKEDEAAMIARGNAFWQTRVDLASKIGTLPPGMDRRAPMETAQFNFFIGEWENEVRWMNDFEKKTYGPTIKGSWKARYSWNGFAISDDWCMPNVPGSGGPAFRSFDPLTRKWVMTYLPSNQPKANIWTMEGNFNEKGEMQAELQGIDASGKAYRQRIFFQDISDEGFLWRADRSYDDGKTWIENIGIAQTHRVHRPTAG